jgi:hypothetical protein
LGGRVKALSQAFGAKADVARAVVNVRL